MSDTKKRLNNKKQNKNVNIYDNDIELKEDCMDLIKAQNKKIQGLFSEITLDSTNGEITKFNMRGRLGENFLVFGIPNQIFSDGKAHSETVVFMVPLLIRTVKTLKPIKNNF